LKRSLFAAALAGLALVSVQAQAQSSLVKPVQFGISGGVAIPSGDLSTDFSTGFNVGAHVGFNPAMIPIGIRVDGAYNQFSVKGGGANTHITSVTGNGIYKFPSMSVTPYAIAGAGWYNTAITVNGLGSASENHFGWNAGGGLSIPLSGFDTFLEARYHRVTGVDGNVSWIPITFGIMF
jgi:opacity protein-like surface antigen